MQTQEEETVDIRAILDHYLVHYKWIIICLLLALGLAFAYLRYATTIYESEASVLVRDDKKGGLGGELSVFSDLGFGGAQSSLYNEKEFLTSRNLMESVVRELNIQKKYIPIGQRSGFRRNEIYKTVPLSMEYVAGDSMFYDSTASFEITIVDKENIKIQLENPSFKINTTFNQPFETPKGIFVVHQTDYFGDVWVGRTVVTNYKTLDEAVIDYRQLLNVESVNKDASVLSISIKGSSIQKNNDILNTLVELHQLNSIENKNEIARNTSKFINERIRYISEELSEVEDTGETFKSSKNLVDVSSDAAMYMEKESALESQIIEATIQLSLADYMVEYLESQETLDILLPANLGFDDPNIAKMTEEYNQLALERNRLTQVTGPKNPQINQIGRQLENLKNSLKRSLDNFKTSKTLQVKELKKEESFYRGKLDKIPEYERQFREIVRQQEVKEQLYLYLLQKREENEITMVGAVSDIQTIDFAYSDGKPVSPKKTIIYLGAFLMGIIFPVGIIYVKGLLDNKVRVPKDIEDVGLPFLGDLPEGGKKERLLTKENHRSQLAEALRMLRTNMHFMLGSHTEGEGKVIMVTSTIPGEGKSFLSINLGISMAQTDKKVVVVGYDLRAPKIMEYADLRNNIGVSNYIVDETISHSDLLQPSEINENLSYITSGHIPPNPSELLLKPRAKSLIQKLKEEFDVVIIDTAPIGMVADTMLVADQADALLYVVRYNHLNKNMLKVPVEKYKANKLGNMGVVLNGVDYKKERHAYGYGYGYGYGNVSNTNKSWLNKLFKKN